MQIFKKKKYILYISISQFMFHDSFVHSIARQDIGKDERMGTVGILPCIRFLIEEGHNPVEVKEINKDTPVNMSYVK